MSTLGTLLSIPGQTMGVSVFTDYLIRDLGLSRNDLTSAYMIGTILSACMLPFAGYGFDRLGARAMIVIASLALGVTLLYLSSCESISHALASLAHRVNLSPSMPTVHMVVLSVGFFLVRFWGQGVVTMVSRAMLGKWFDRLRGRASALSGIFVSAGFAVTPKVLLELIEMRGWRGAWFDLAFACFVWAVLAWVFYRDNPEECGLEMDGGAKDSPRAAAAPPVVVRDFTLREATKTYGFWIASASLSMFALVGTGMTFHITSIGAKAGLDKTAAVLIFLPMAVVSVVTNIVGGWLSDRVRIRNLFWALLVGQIIAGFSLLYFASAWGRHMVSLGFGVSGGLFTLLLTVIWPRFYGRKHLGAISAVSTATGVLGSAVGPKCFAMAEAVGGRYDVAFISGAAVAMILCIAVIFLENPQRPRSPERH